MPGREEHRDVSPEVRAEIERAVRLLIVAKNGRSSTAWRAVDDAQEVLEGLLRAAVRAEKASDAR